MASNLQTVEELSGLFERLQSKRDKLQEQLGEVEKEVSAVETTLKLMGHLTPGLSNIDLHGLNQLDALIKIAKSNHNKLAVKTARRLMVKAGFFKNTKNASSILFTTINRSGKFEREEAGVYRLIEGKKPEESTLSLLEGEPVAQ